MIIIWKIRFGRWGIKIRWRDGSLIVRCSNRRKEKTKLWTEPIESHSNCECLVALDRLASSIKLETILGRVYVASSCRVVPSLKESSWAQTTKAVIAIYLSCEWEFLGKHLRPKERVSTEVRVVMGVVCTQTVYRPTRMVSACSKTVLENMKSLVLAMTSL